MSFNKWALIGSGGFIAPRHRAAIEHIGDRVILTCDINPQSHPDFIDWGEMRRSKEWGLVTHVALCVPNDLHYSMAMEAAKEGKIVLCEKPLTVSPWTCEQMPENVYTVLQLRHHPEVIRLKIEGKTAKEVEMRIKVKRDASYWHSWKGQEARSGGILFNLGIHYFDLLIYLFGDEAGLFKIEEVHTAPRKASGTVIIGTTRCKYTIEISDSADGQDRALTIDGKPVSLSKSDNLSFEDLHKRVYEALIFDHVGVTPKEAMKSIILVDTLKRISR